MLELSSPLSSAAKVELPIDVDMCQVVLYFLVTHNLFEPLLVADKGFSMVGISSMDDHGAPF